MKSYHMNSGAGLDGIILREREEPKPGPYEVLLRIHAVSLNFRELLIARGLYLLPVKPDVIAVSDGAGEVIALGSDVTRVKIGDRVAAAIFPRWIDGPFVWEHSAQMGGSLDGMLTEYSVLHEDALVTIPDHLSFEEAATLPCAAVTAWNALTGGRGLRKGQSVLVSGSGAVALFALQFAKSSDAQVIATTSSDEKAARLKDLGADHVMNYCTTPEWHTAVREMTGGRGVDHVVETGGTGNYDNTIKSVAPYGEISLVGRRRAQDGSAAVIDSNLLFRSIATIRGIAVGSRAQFIAMNEFIDRNKIRPVIDRVFSFAEAIEAFRYYETGKNFGKVVITCF